MLDFPSSLRPFVSIAEHSDQILLADMRRRELPRRRPERPRLQAPQVFSHADHLLRVPNALHRRRHSKSSDMLHTHAHSKGCDEGFIKLKSYIFADNVLWASGKNEIQRAGASGVSGYVQQQERGCSLCKALSMPFSYFQIYT